MAAIDRRGLSPTGASPSSPADPSAGVAIKTPVVAATTAAITLAALQGIDGVTVAEGDRVLVKDQASSVENGIYLASSGNWTRATDADGSGELTNGTIVYATGGTVSANKPFRLSATNPVVVGTSAQVWVAVSFASSDAALVVATSSPALTSSRLLAGEASVVTITDGGALGDITVSLTANGVTNAKLRQGAARSVIGVTGNAAANVADIAGTAYQILCVNAAGDALAFGAIDVSRSEAVGSSVLLGANGGTGVANTGKTITLGGNLSSTSTVAFGGAFATTGTFSTAAAFATSGAFALTLTVTALTDVTLPTTGTLATLAGAETFLNKVLTAATITTSLVPTSDDGAALGSTANKFSDLFLASGAVVNFNSGDVTLTHSADTLTMAGGTLVLPASGLQVGSSNPFSDSAGTLTLQNVDALDPTTESTIEAAIDTLANLTSIQGNTFTLTGAFIRSGAHSLTLTTTGTTGVTLPTTGTLATLAGAETLSGKVLTAATITTSLVPTSNDGAALGSTANQFSDLFLAEGGVINWDNGDVTITQTGNVLSFAGATTRYEFGSTLTPTASDGAALGTTALMFSDLFLASGAVVNFNNGDVTVTHSADTLTFAGASSGYIFDAAMSGITNFTLSSFIDLTEIASPASPSADHLRLFAKDVTGATHLFVRDSAGTEVDLSAGGGGGAAAATQAEMEAASSTSTYVSPGRAHFAPSAGKWWVYATNSAGTYTVQGSYNHTSFSDDGVGVLTWTIATDFSGVTWASYGCVESGATMGNFGASTKTAGTIQTDFRVASTGASADATFNGLGFGDHA